MVREHNTKVEQPQVVEVPVVISNTEMLNLIYSKVAKIEEAVNRVPKTAAKRKAVKTIPEEDEDEDYDDE